MERRKFIKDILLAGAGIAMSPLINASENNLFNKESYKKSFLNKNSEFINSIEKEKLILIKEIKSSIEEAILMEDLKNQANEIFDKLENLDKNSVEYNKLDKKFVQISQQYQKGRSYSLGSNSAKILKEANQYAEQIINNDEVLEKLAFLQLVRKNDNLNFNYIHNYSKAYLEILPNINVYDKTDKIISLFSKDFLSDIKQENLFYFFQNENFDPQLKIEQMSILLNNKKPEWKNMSANNYDGYLSNNDLSKFNVFEFNRIKDLINKFDDQKFIDQIFTARYNDIYKEQLSEIGGVIPIMGLEIKEIKPSQKNNNESYYPSIEIEFLRLSSLVEFHFHATQFDNNKYSGPSFSDAGSTFPNVVFTSLNKNQIATHFYFSHNKPFSKIYDQIVVVSLGLLENNNNFIK